MAEMPKSTSTSPSSSNGIKSRAPNNTNSGHVVQPLKLKPSQRQKAPRSEQSSKSNTNHSFLKITSIVFVIAIVDVVFVWKSINASIGGEGNEPHHVGAEAGLHHLHEKKRLKQLNDHVMAKNEEQKNRGTGNTNALHLQPKKNEKGGKVITANTNGDIIDDTHNAINKPLKQGSSQTHKDTTSINANGDIIDENGKVLLKSRIAKSTQIDERIAKLLKSAKVEVDEETASKLPTWENVIAQYGESPKVYGLETCEPYRQSIKPEDRMIGPAGTFNSGTNLLFQLMKENCNIKEAAHSKTHSEPKKNGVRWQAPWGKHNPPQTHRFKNKAKMWGEGIDHGAFFPVVMIKDPYSWMGSQCRHHYQAWWEHGDGNCPNLIQKKVVESDVPEMVYVKYALGGIKYESLIDMWNTFYLDYEQQTFPMLRMRYEDLLFHGEEVTKIACECVGGVFTKTFTYIEGSAKENGMPIHIGANGLVKALLQYGDPEKRLEGLTERDRLYASRALSSELMEKYSYSAPPLPT